MKREQWSGWQRGGKTDKVTEKEKQKEKKGESETPDNRKINNR